MVSVDQSAALAAMIADGWARAPSKRPLAEHKLGEPILVVRAESFMIVMPNGTTESATAQQVAEW